MGIQLQKSKPSSFNGKAKGDFQPHPEGSYLFNVDTISAAPLKNGNGNQITVRLTSTVGEKKQSVWNNFIVDHTSAKCQEIGQETLGKFLKALGYDVSFSKDSFDDLDSTVGDLEDTVVGGKLMADIVWNEYNGKQYANAKRFRKA